MTITKKMLAVLLVLMILLNVGCKSESKKKLDIGTFEGNTYKNDYFGLELNIPEGWTILDEATKAELLGASSELLAGDDSAKEKQIDLSLEKTLYYVLSFKHPMTYQEGFNPNFMCLSEQISKLQGVVNQIKIGEDYLNASKELLLETGMPYSFDKEIYQEDVGGKSFYVMEVTLDYSPMIITQKYYATLLDQDRYAFAFVVSYSTDEEKAEVESIIKTVKFK